MCAMYYVQSRRLADEVVNTVEELCVREMFMSLCRHSYSTIP